MRELKRRSRFARSFSAGDEDAVLDEQITSLEDELSDELDGTEGAPAPEEVIPVSESEGACPECGQEPCVCESGDEISASALIAQADALIASIEGRDASTDTTVADDKEIIAKEIADVEAKIAAVQAKEQEKSEKSCVAKELEDAERKIASLEKKGIEDEITQTAPGAVPTTSNLVETKIDVETLPEAAGLNRKYVASITKRLDRVANILEEKGMKRLAFRVDQLSDKIESSIK